MTYFDKGQLRFISLYDIGFAILMHRFGLLTFNINIGFTNYTKQSAYRKQIYKL